VLSAASIRRRGLFDTDEVARLVRADREGRIDAAYTIFAVVCIELWCRMCIDGIPSKSPLNPPFVKGEVT
jgi:asparagine synthase (glutamine-hydrolysing)